MNRKLLFPGFWDLVVGLPAGMLIFMATVLLTTATRGGGALLILAATALLVGWLAGITRLRRGPATGLMAGLVMAGLLGYLWLAARPGDSFNPLVIGPLGMATTALVTPLGGWLGAKTRKAL